MTEEAKFTWYFLGKALEEHIEIVEEHDKKQVQALKILKFSDRELPPMKILALEKSLNPEIKN